MPLKKENKPNSKNERKPIPKKRKTGLPTDPSQSVVKKLKSSVVENKKGDTPVSGWTVKELSELTCKIENSIPVNDNNTPVRPQKTLKSLDWNSFSVGQHSGEECKDAWLNLQRRVRSYRTLKEIVQLLKEDIYANKFQKLGTSSLSLFLREKRIETCGEKGALTDEAIRQFKTSFEQMSKTEKAKYAEMATRKSSKKTKKTELTAMQQDS